MIIDENIGIRNQTLCIQQIKIVIEMAIYDTTINKHGL